MQEKENRDIKSEILSKSSLLATYLDIDTWIESDPDRLQRSAERKWGRAGAYNFGWHIRDDVFNFENRSLLDGILVRDTIIMGYIQLSDGGLLVDPGIKPLFYIGYEAKSMDDLKLFVPDLVDVFKRRGYFTEEAINSLSNTQLSDQTFSKKADEARNLLLEIMEFGHSQRNQEIPFVCPQEGVIRRLLDRMPPVVPDVFEREVDI